MSLEDTLNKLVINEDQIFQTNKKRKPRTRVAKKK